MEVAFIVYSDGAIFESDISTGQILKQIQNVQSSCSITPSLVDTISNIGDPFSSTSALFIQNKSSTKSSIVSCFDNHVIEVFTPASSLGGSGIVTCVAISKCGNWLFRGLQNGSILVTNLRPSIQANTSSKTSTGKSQLSHRIVQTSHIGPITCITTNSTGWIATSSEDRTIIVSPLSQFLKFESNYQQSSKIEIRLQGHTLPITDMYFSADGRLISISRDQTLKMWDVFSQTKLCNISFPSALTCMTVAPTETSVYVGAKDGNIFKVNFVDIKEHDSDFRMNLEDNNETNERSYCYAGHNQPITSVRLTLDCTKLISTSQDGSVITWDESTCQKLCVINPHKVSAVWCQVYLKPSFPPLAKRKKDFTEKSISSTTLNESIVPMTSQCTNVEYVNYFCSEVEYSPLKAFVEPIVSDYMIKQSNNLFTDSPNFVSANN